MKKIIAMLLLTSGMYAQQVFNVQQYCIDEKPLKAGGCDISGNEYSFVFVDAKKKAVNLFLASTKLKYGIISAATHQGSTIYTLKSDSGTVEMRINASKTTIEFLCPERNITLKVGKSTKAT